MGINFRRLDLRSRAIDFWQSLETKLPGNLGDGTLLKDAEKKAHFDLDFLAPWVQDQIGALWY